MKALQASCRACGWTGRADVCDSIQLAAGTRAADVLGAVVTIAGERRRLYCRRCNEPAVFEKG